MGSILILYSHIHILGLLCDLFPWGFLVKILHVLLNSSMRSTYPAHPTYFNWFTLIIWSEVLSDYLCMLCRSHHESFHILREWQLSQFKAVPSQGWRCNTSEMWGERGGDKGVERMKEWKKGFKHESAEKMFHSPISAGFPVNTTNNFALPLLCLLMSRYFTRSFHLNCWPSPREEDQFQGSGTTDLYASAFTCALGEDCTDLHNSSLNNYYLLGVLQTKDKTQQTQKLSSASFKPFTLHP
jgi:hypothetical protein